MQRAHPDRGGQAGQASSDYVGLLAVVAVVLAGAAAATSGLDGVPERVRGAVRTGLCIVGGDICRTADAAAAGLAPCLVTDSADGGGLTVSIVSVRLGRSGEWTVARRSDGSVVVTRSDAASAGVGTGLGLEVGALRVGASGSLDLEVTDGRAWELTSQPAARRFLAGVRDGRDPTMEPTWRFGDIGEKLVGGANVNVAGLDVTGVEATAAVAAGARIGRGERTMYLHTDLDVAGPLALLPGVSRGAGGTSAGAGGRRAGPVLMSLTRDRGGLREIAFRRLEAADGRVVETVARLDLREPANRAAAAPLLERRLPWPPAVMAELRALVRHTVVAGTVERAVYAVQDRSHEISAAVRLGAELGIAASAVDVQRRLVGASAWTAGSPERRREDCLGGA